MSEKQPRVAQVLNPMEVVINVGQVDGVEAGQRFVVYTLGDEVIDPETKESLGRLEIVRGVGVAKHVQARMATLRSTEKRTVLRTRREQVPAPLGVMFLPAVHPQFELLTYDDAVDAPFADVQVGDLVRAF